MKLRNAYIDRGRLREIADCCATGIPLSRLAAALRADEQTQRQLLTLHRTKSDTKGKP